MGPKLLISDRCLGLVEHGIPCENKSGFLNLQETPLFLNI